MGRTFQIEIDVLADAFTDGLENVAVVIRNVGRICLWRQFSRRSWDPFDLEGSCLLNNTSRALRVGDLYTMIRPIR